MERIKQFFASIRVRLVVFAVAIALTPLVFVSFGPVYEWIAEYFMRNNLSQSVMRAQEYVPGGSGEIEKPDRKALTRLADDLGVWLRIVDTEGEELFSARRAIQAQQYKVALESATGDKPQKPHLVAYDESRPPMTRRSEFLEAKESGEASGCDIVQDGRLLSCIAVYKVVGSESAPLYIYVQDGSIRGIRALWDNPYPLVKLVLQLLIFSLIVGLIAGWWSVRPLDKLHEQVMDRAEPPVSTKRVGVGSSGELGELEDAFNALLEALEQRREATESYMADIAHEVKNPVAAIQSAAARLETGDVSEKRIERISNVLQDSSERLDKLVTRFLDLARAEAGLDDEPRENVDVGRLAEQLVSRFEDDERFRDIDFSFDADGLSVTGSSTHLETALRNLIENAGSFAESTVRVSVEELSGKAKIIVEDDGPGIEPDDLPHVFERFFSRRPGNKGTGLGLAMTRAIVEAHDGEIDVESTVGEGTRFTIYLDAES
jgi:two-component system sensor histidine kinase ChvG